MKIFKIAAFVMVTLSISLSSVYGTTVEVAKDNLPADWVFDSGRFGVTSVSDNYLTYIDLSFSDPSTTLDRERELASFYSDDILDQADVGNEPLPKWKPVTKTYENENIFFLRAYSKTSPDLLGYIAYDNNGEGFYCAEVYGGLEVVSTGVCSVKAAPLHGTIIKGKNDVEVTLNLDEVRQAEIEEEINSRS